MEIPKGRCLDHLENELISSNSSAKILGISFVLPTLLTCHCMTTILLPTDKVKSFFVNNSQKMEKKKFPNLSRICAKDKYTSS